MYITLIDSNLNIVEIACRYGFDAYDSGIKNYQPVGKQIFYVIPIQSVGLSNNVVNSNYIEKFPNLEYTIKELIKKYGKSTKLGRFYLPIGSAIIKHMYQNIFIIISSTMLLLQNVAETKNSYYCMKGVLNVLKKWGGVNNSTDELIIVPFCCGVGGMVPKESIQQINNSINDFQDGSLVITNGEKFFIDEPSLSTQPNYYENGEWFNIDPEKIILKKI